MQIVTDSGVDITMSSEELEANNIHIVPLRVTLGEETFREGLDINKDDFYARLEKSKRLA